MQKLIRKKLSNGLAAFFVPNPQGETTTISIYVKTGADYESAKENGISHFLEHLCFKGTERRPTALAIAHEIETLGAAWNASTSRESTSFYAKVEASFWQQAFDIIADIYLHSIFDPKEIEKERGVVIEEMNMYEDNPRQKLDRLFRMAVYGNQAAGRPIIGSKENILRLSQKDIVAYRAKHYIPSQTIVVLSGCFKLAEAEQLIQKTFGALPKNKTEITRAPFTERKKGAVRFVEQKKLEQTHIRIGFRSFPFSDSRYWATNLCGEILGGGMSSRLSQKIREEKGAAYYVGAGNASSSNRGIFNISAGLNHGKTEEVLKMIFEELRLLSAKGVSPEELTRAKNQYIGSFVLDLETSDQFGDFYAGQYINRGKIDSPEYYKRKIRAVTQEDVKRVARDIFKNDTMTFGAIGPFKNGKFSDIVKL